MILVFAILLFFTIDANAALRYLQPQGPSGHESCTNGNRNRDLDGDGLIGRIDPGCTSGAYNQFSAVTGGYAAYLENGFLTEDLEIVANGDSPSGNVVQVKSTARFGYGDVRVCGNFSNAAYYSRLFGVGPVSGSPTASGNLIYIDGAPIASHPAQTLLTTTAIPEPTADWQNAVMQRGYNPATNSFTETTYTETLNGNACIDIRLFKGMQVATIFLTTNPTQAPAHPGAAASGDYVIYKKGAGNTITIDGNLNEGVWADAAGAPIVPWLGGANSNDTVPTVQILRDGTTIYVAMRANDSNTSCDSTGDDQSNTWSSCDNWEVLFHDSQAAPRGTNTVKISLDINGNLYDANYPSDSESSTFDFTGVTKACSVTTNVSKTCEIQFTLPWSPTDSTLTLGNVLMSDYDTSYTYNYFGVAGGFNSLANARTFEWSATALGTLTTPDVTAPSFVSRNSGTPDSSSATLTVVVDEPASCTFKWDTSSGTYAGYANTLGTVATQPSGGNFAANLQLTGLSASTTYYWAAQCSDSVPNTATDSEQTFATTATPSGSGGDFFELVSTWYQPTGANITAQRAVFNDPAPNSAARIADILASTNDKSWGMQGGNTGSRPVICRAKNTDPLVTFTDAMIFSSLKPPAAWRTLRLPTSCSPGGTIYNQDQHLVVINDDDADFLWDFYGASHNGTTWQTHNMRRFCRNAAACTGNDGAGRGVFPPPQGFDGYGALTQCGSSATNAHGAFRKSEIDAGEIKHALRFVYDGEAKVSYIPRYPCYFEPQSGNGSSPDGLRIGDRIVLDPDFNLDAVAGLGQHAKIVLKAFQKYGAFFMDSGCAGCRVNTFGEAADWSGYDFSTPSDIMTTIISNSRIIKCVESYAGECTGWTGTD